jgi:DNA-binding NarL/FixJ family response regulator
MSLTERESPNKIRILLADSHPQLREQLAARLSREPDLDVIEVTANSIQTLRETKERQPDVLLIDPFMEDGMGLATIRQVRTEMSAIVIVILTAFIDTALNKQLRQMGITHILVKGVLPAQLLSEVRAAVKNSASF